MTKKEAVDLIDHYAQMSTEALITEGQRLARREHVVDDAQLSAFLALLLGRVALLQDRVTRLSVMCRITMN